MSKVQDTDWYKEKPLQVQQIIDKHPPDRLYRIKTTGQIAFLFSYDEEVDGSCKTCTVNITQRFNPFCIQERRVDGIPLSDLEDVETVWNEIAQDAFKEAHLSSIFIPVSGDEPVSVAQATDEQFNDWAMTRAHIIGIWKGVPWTIPERIAFCNYLRQSAVLEMFEAEVGDEA